MDRLFLSISWFVHFRMPAQTACFRQWRRSLGKRTSGMDPVYPFSFFPRGKNVSFLPENKLSERIICRRNTLFDAIRKRIFFQGAFLPPHVTQNPVVFYRIPDSFQENYLIIFQKKY